MKFVIYSGILFDLEMEIVTNNYYKTIELYIEGNSVKTWASQAHISPYLKKRFEYLEGINPRYKAEIRSFVGSFNDIVIVKKAIYYFMKKYYYILYWFAKNFKEKGTLDYNNFKIGDYEISFGEFNEVEVFVLEQERQSIILTAAALRQEKSYSFEEDVYLVLMCKLNKLFKTLNSFGIKEFKYKFITIKKKEDM